jgi:hypothetical protein
MNDGLRYNQPEFNMIGNVMIRKNHIGAKPGLKYQWPGWAVEGTAGFGFVF